MGGRLLLGFCYRTFFVGVLWGLCHARKFFKDITHSYYGYGIPVTRLYVRPLMRLYHTLYCVDTILVSCLCPVSIFACVRVCLYLYLCLLASVFYTCVTAHIVPVFGCSFMPFVSCLMCCGVFHVVPICYLYTCCFAVLCTVLFLFIWCVP